MSDIEKIFTTTAGGLALIGLAILIKIKKPDWWGFQALLALAGGAAALPLLALLVSKVEQGIQWCLNWVAGTGTWQPVLPTVMNALAIALPWIIGIVLLGALALDMFPRLGALRGGKHAATGGSYSAGMPGGGSKAQAIGARLAGLNDARSHTMWVAVLVPAAIAAVPPLAHLFRIGG